MNYRITLIAAAAIVAAAAAPVLAQVPASPAPASESATAADIQALTDPAVEEHLRAVQAAIPEGKVMSTLRGRLGAGTKQSLSVRTAPGDWYIAAVCDDACGNLDLRMLTPQGQVAFANELPDKFPIAQAKVTTAVDFNVEVVMKACAKDPCAWGVSILKK